MTTTTIKRRKQRALYIPADKEMIKALKWAVCKLYEISEEDFMNDPGWAIAGLRFNCFWLLSQNSGLKDYEIGAAFGKCRRTANYGIDQVDSQRHVYKSVSSSLKAIIAEANEFPNKKFQWHLQSISITPS
jgi:hypothetical protein